MELVERVAQLRVVVAAHRVDAGEDERQRLPVAGEGSAASRPAVVMVSPTAGLADALQAAGDVPDLTGHETLARDRLRPEVAQLEDLRLGAGAHEADALVVVERAGGEPDVGDDALVRVVVAVEDEGLERRADVGGRRRDAVDDRLEHVVHAGPVLGADEQDVLARDGERLLELAHHHLRVGGGQVDLVDDRDDRQVLGHGEVHVRERLGLDPLAGVDDQDRALACLEGPADLVGEVDVPGRVDEVEGVRLAVGGVVVRRTARALIVIPFSRSSSIESSTCEVIWRLSIVWVASSSRSASVDFPWSMCATMLKLRMRSGGITRRSLAKDRCDHRSSRRGARPPAASRLDDPADGPTATMPVTVAYELK